MTVRESTRCRLSEAYTSPICIENTHNFAGGTVIPRENLQELGLIARQYGLPVHYRGVTSEDSAYVGECVVAAARTLA